MRMRTKKPKTKLANNWQSIKTYIPYAIAFMVGLFLQPIICLYKGWEYSINGKDLLMGLLFIVMVWSFKGTFLQPRNRG